VGHDPPARAWLYKVALRESYRAGTPREVPRELRHSFVSIMRDNGVPIETIADLVGHASTAVTETVYRHQLMAPRLAPEVCQALENRSAGGGQTMSDLLFPGWACEDLNLGPLPYQGSALTA
jgi:hypothetical protein